MAKCWLGILIWTWLYIGYIKLDLLVVKLVIMWILIVLTKYIIMLWRTNILYIVLLCAEIFDGVRGLFDGVRGLFDVDESMPYPDKVSFLVM